MKSGDYARTKSGIIGKIIIKEDTIAVAKWQGGYELQDTTTYTIGDTHFHKSDIIKSSPSIIDLIEVGDYVNGCPVLHKEGNELVCGLILRYKEKNIQNVVTKEQFEAIQYNLESQVISNE